MSEVQRYNIYGTHASVAEVEDEEGDWVEYTDYESLKADKEALVSEIKFANKHCEKLLAENKRLREVLKSARDMLVMCTLLDKSGQVAVEVEKADEQLEASDE